LEGDSRIGAHYSQWRKMEADAQGCHPSVAREGGGRLLERGRCMGWFGSGNADLFKTKLAMFKTLQEALQIVGINFSTIKNTCVQ
jgi:hypothetical protein